MLVANVKGLLEISLEFQKEAVGQNEIGRQKLADTHQSLGRLLTLGNDDFGATLGNSIGSISEAKRVLNDGYWRVDHAYGVIEGVTRGMKLPLVELGKLTTEAYGNLSTGVNKITEKVFQLHGMFGGEPQYFIDEILAEGEALIKQSQELEPIEEWIAATQELYNSL